MGRAQYFKAGQDIQGEWWEIFHSPALNRLIAKGLANNPTLAAAKAALTQAQQTLYAEIGSNYLPAVNSQFAGARQRNVFLFPIANNKLPALLYNLFNANLQVSYTVDVFGALRRQVESYRAQVDYQRYELEAAFLTLSSNIASTAINIASLKAQIKATYDIIRLEKQQLVLLNKQYDLGATAKENVLTQEIQLAQFQATLPPLEQSLEVNQHALAVLIGQYPDDNQLPDFKLHKFNLPRDLPVSLPAKLLQQRPDIQAAEALVHVASAQVGVATANLYPTLSLNNNLYGWTATTLNSLFNARNLAWTWGGAVSESIFNGGALVATQRAAVANFQQAAAEYRQTVLSAFQNVADTLRAIENDAQELVYQVAAEKASYQALNIITQQFKYGGVSYFDLYIAQLQYHQAHIARVVAEADRYSDTVALFQALGGGWWNRSSLSKNPVLDCNVAAYTPENVLVSKGKSHE